MKFHDITTGKSRRGFTLIDLTVTVLILGILASVTAPRFTESMSFFRAESAAKRLAADLRMARKYAIDKSRPQTIRFYLRKNSYSITTLIDPDHPGTRYSVELSGYPYQAVISKLTFATRDELVFDIHGHINFSGEIVIQSGSTSRSVTFDATNGEVRVL